MGGVMTVRNAWNLWRFIITFGGTCFLGIIGLTILEGAWWTAVVIMSWFIGTAYIASTKYKCPKCGLPLGLHRTLQTFGAYWPSRQKGKCIHCGELVDPDTDVKEIFRF